MSENQWLQLVGLLAVLAIVAWRLPGRTIFYGVLMGLAMALLAGGFHMLSGM